MGAAGRDPEVWPMKPTIRVNVEVKANLAEMIRALALVLAALGTLIL
jgi:hypothetical protein